jgi:BirA family transcriptional regulator, biotin operon repressor / biotin---[acetyl-CoA-carboxylase] ligase
MVADVSLPPGYRLVHFTEIDSTNAEAMRRAAQGETGPTWYWADRQLQGRGRLGRGWVSEPGNLYASLLISLSTPASRASGLGIVVSLAVLQTFRAFLPASVSIGVKWPNDVLIAGKKAAGILVESTSQGQSMQIALGCGLNLRSAPPHTRYGATALADHAALIAPSHALERLAKNLDKVLSQWNGGAGFNSIRNEWLRHTHALGKEIILTSASGEIRGRFEGLGENGSLLLRNRSGLQEFHAGEVSLTDSAEGPA